jgi:hypothetical protein
VDRRLTGTSATCPPPNTFNCQHLPAPVDGWTGTSPLRREETTRSKMKSKSRGRGPVYPSTRRRLEVGRADAMWPQERLARALDRFGPQRPQVAWRPLGCASARPTRGNGHPGTGALSAGVEHGGVGVACLDHPAPVFTPALKRSEPAGGRLATPEEARGAYAAAPPGLLHRLEAGHAAAAHRIAL